MEKELVTRHRQVLIGLAFMLGMVVGAIITLIVVFLSIAGVSYGL